MPESSADKVKAARKALNMSQTELAKALGISRGKTISAWEQGRREPPGFIWPALEQLRRQL